METFTIVPHARAGTYSVMATTTDGKQTLVATFPTEEGAVLLLRRLQEKNRISSPDDPRLRERH